MSVRDRAVLVTGGAGFLGRITAEILARRGYEPLLLDDFSTGHRAAVQGLPFIEIDLTDRAKVVQLFSELKQAHAIVHFAAKAVVPESVKHPGLYFRNNLLSTLNLAECAVEHRIRYFVHSSSCSVYGVPTEIPIPETTPPNPITPYGESKWLAERMLGQFQAHQRLQILNLRYFNPAGALDGFGENHHPETHLVPNVIRAFRNDSPVSIFGDDYDTEDGTCVRDFIHVADLAEAHLAALEWLESEPTHRPEAINIGAGVGTSVKTLIREAEKLFKKNVPLRVEPRRPGDPAKLVADISLAKSLLGWAPRRSLKDLLSDHLRWEQTQKGS